MALFEFMPTTLKPKPVSQSQLDALENNVLRNLNLIHERGRAEARRVHEQMLVLEARVKKLERTRSPVQSPREAEPGDLWRVTQLVRGEVVTTYLNERPAYDHTTLSIRLYRPVN